MLLDWCPDLLAEFYKGFVLRRPEADAERMGRPALIGNVPSFCYEKRLAQLRLPTWLYAPRRGARRHDHQPETGSRARCLRGHLQPSRRHAEDDARAGRLPVHQQPHDPAWPGRVRGSRGEGSAASSLPAMAQRAGVAAHAGVAKHAGGRRHGALGRDGGAASRGDAGLGVLDYIPVVLPTLSLPGLTPQVGFTRLVAHHTAQLGQARVAVQSILFAKSLLRRKMDPRVKPAGDTFGGR